jgi:hypothetical protein
MRRALAICVSWFALALPGAAEQPRWDEISEQLLVVRIHSFYHPEDLALWSFDPDTSAWERLRYFAYNAEQELDQTQRGCALAAADGVVSFQAWPMNLELEPGSYRILRRTSPIADPAAVGLSVQGPQVGHSDSARLGLEPGTYGIGVCRIIAPLFPTAQVCDPYLLPGTDQPVECRPASPWPLVFRDQAAGLDLTALLPPLDWPPWLGSVHPTLSLDAERNAFWRGTPRGVELVPVAGGAIGQPVESRTFEFPPFDNPERVLNTLFYHPQRHQFFLTTDGYDFLSLDESFEKIADFELSNTPLPVTMTSLGEPPESLEQLLPVVAHTPGVNDTFWTSDLWLFNPSSEPTTVTLRRVAAPGQACTVELAGHASTRIADALAFLGGGPGGDGAAHDAVLVTSPYRWGEQLVAASRTFTAAEGGGTFGHAVTAAPGRAGYSNHLVYPGEPEPAWISYPVGLNVPAGSSTLYADRRVPGQFRHNLGVVNDFDQTVTLTLLWGFLEGGRNYYPAYMALRPASAIQSVEVAPHSVRILALESLFPPEVAEVWPPRIAVWGSRPVALWTSMVDNLTGDATFVPYSAMHWGSDLYNHQILDVRAAAPVVAHTSGEGGTAWRTDLYGGDEQLAGYAAAAWLHPQDLAHDCNGAGLLGEVEAVLWPEVAQPPEAWEDRSTMWGTVYPDVARAFAPCASEQDLHAGFELLSATWLMGWTRTYTTRPDGGTYGEMLPLYPLGGWPVQHFAGVEVGERFRVNVGLFNGEHEHAITHRITLYAADGHQVAERTLTLQPLASFQRRLEHLFGLDVGSIPAGTYGMTVLPLDDPANGVKGRSWAWVSLVDNVTGDPTNWW